MSEEAKRKMSEARKGKPAWNKGKHGLQTAWNKGKKLSEEAKRKLSESHKGKSSGMKGKKRIWDDETHTKYHYE